MSEEALIIFIKNPVKGKVKTRLAKSLGDEGALEAYLQLLNYTHRVSLGVQCDRYLYYSERVQEDAWSESDFKKEVQFGDDLGLRMYHAFESVLKNHSSAIIIGSDCAELTSQIIVDGFNKLRSSDAVLGPSRDGGYYLLGLKQARPEVFQNIEWSSEKVFPRTVQILQSLGWTLSYLEELSDIDHFEDWEKFKSLLF